MRTLCEQLAIESLSSVPCHASVLQQYNSRNCCPAAQGLNMGQLEALIRSATGRMWETGRRPLSANPDFTGMTHSDRFAILSSMYGELPKKVSNRKPTKVNRVSLGRHLGDQEAQEVLIVHREEAEPRELVHRYVQTDLSSQAPKPAAKTILSSPSTVRRAVDETDAEKAAKLLERVGSVVGMVAKFLTDADQSLESILQLSHDAKAALLGPEAKLWVSDLAAAASAAASGSVKIALSPRILGANGMEPDFGVSIGQLVERVGSRVGKSVWIAGKGFGDATSILKATPHVDHDFYKGAIEAHQAVVSRIIQPGHYHDLLLSPESATRGPEDSPESAAAIESPSHVAIAAGAQSELASVLPLLRLLQGASSRLSAGLAAALSSALEAHDHHPGNVVLADRWKDASQAVDECQQIILALHDVFDSATREMASRPCTSSEVDAAISPASDLIIQLRETGPMALNQRLMDLLRAAETLQRASSSGDGTSPQQIVAAVLDVIWQLRGCLSDLAALTVAAETTSSRAAEPFGITTLKCHPSSSTLPALAGHLTALVDSLDAMYKAGPITDKLHAAALVPVMQVKGPP